MMERTAELFELIEAYLSGGMGETERAAFELRIRESKELEMEVEKHRILSEALKDDAALAFRKKVSTIAGDFKAKQKSTVNSPNIGTPKNHFLKVAAGVLVLFGLGVVLWWQINTRASTYDRYYEPYAIEGVMRGADADALAVVAKNYAKGKYVEVIPQLVNLIEQHPEKTELQLYLANSYLQTDQALSAITLLKRIEVGNPRFEAARWYLALSYLKADDKAAAKTVVEELIAYDGIYRSQAEGVLGELQ